jgi:serine/threonine-protein kinase RsbT
LKDDLIRLHYEIPENDLTIAGEASSRVRKMLNQLGISPAAVKRATVAMYEAEMNAVIHALGGTADIEVSPDSIRIVITDRGPGIHDIKLAMQEGYSTAPDHIREIGFGAGMGLPNMKKYADDLDISSEPGKGTVVTIKVNLK